MNIAVIGGGASGLVAAIAAARAGGNVTIFEKNDKLGRKILATGNGRCNFSNMTLNDPDRIDIRDFYHGSDPEFAKTVLEQFSLQDTIRFFSELGIMHRDQNGYLYPYSNQASSICEVLNHEVNRLGIHVQCGYDVKKIVHQDPGFIVETVSANGRSQKSFDRVIISMGSKADPKSGSDGWGYHICESLGLRLKQPLPCLTYLASGEKWLKQCAGVRFDDVCVTIRITDDKETVRSYSECGNIQFTEKGISGIVVFQLSSITGRSLSQGLKAEALVDLMPQMTDKMMIDYLSQRMMIAKGKDCSEALVGLLPEKLIPVILHESGVLLSKPAVHLSADEIKSIAETIKGLSLSVTGTGDFEHAQTCSGGIVTDDLDTSLEAKCVPGLFVAGEIIDIDGICGGYNLQFAWSSGWVSGINAAR